MTGGITDHSALRGISHGLRSVACVFFALIFWMAQLQSALADIDNTARAVGVFNGTGVFSPTSSQSIPVIPANPLIEVNKSGVLNDDDGTPGLSAGDTISYTILVTNPGNVSLTGITVTDPLVALTFVGGDADNDFRLDPTETWTYTGSYTITNFDLVTRGGGDDDIDNTVTADSNESAPDTDTQETIIDPNVSMAVAKVGTLNDDDGTPGLSAGDTISYVITVENNGTSDLTNPVVSDTLGQSGVDTPLVTTFSGGDLNNDTIINGGETWTYTASYTLTQANIDDGGNIVNTASISTDQLGPRDAIDTQVLAGFVDSYTMTKLASLNDGDGDNLADAGETITFTFRFVNTGNRTLANLLPSDPLPGLSAIVCSNDLDSDGDIDLLSVGQTLDCSATYTVQPSDILNGSVNNTATSSATRINGLVPVAEDDSANDNSTMTPTDSNFEIDVNKTVTSSVEVLPNVVEIEYLIEVENLANILQTGVAVRDDIAAAISAPAQLIGDASVVSISGFSGTGGANPGFNGTTDTQLLDANVDLAPLATGQIRVLLRVDRRGQSLTTLNTAFGTTDQIPGDVPSDDPGETPGDPNDVNPTPFEIIDTDEDGSPDGDESDVADRDGDGITDAQDYDPTGYFYCEEDGRILTGGSITVVNVSAGGAQTGIGSSNDITILQDGSAGFYQFYVTAPGTYQLLFSLPPGGAASTDRTTLGSLDVTSLLPSNPGVIGSGAFGNTGVLADFAAGSNPFYTEFVIEDGDPIVFNNNIPLMFCGTPSLTANKEIASGPSIQADGTHNLTYRVTAENDGPTQINEVSLVDDLTATFGAGNFTILSTSIESAPPNFGASIDPFFDGAGSTNLLTGGPTDSGNLAPGESVSVLIALNIDVVPGVYTNTVTAGGNEPLGNTPLPTVDASVPIEILAATAEGGIIATKTTPVDSVPLGGVVPYTLTFENPGPLNLAGAEFVDLPPRGFTYVPGTATINDVPVEPELRGFELVWPNQNIAAGDTITVNLSLRVGVGINGTEFTNRAFVRDPITGNLLSNRAQATVRLEVESVFQCSHVIGRVFDDLNKDGYHDTGEPGLGGVRLASVGGLLITTDQFGRYHIACDAIPDSQIGSNYILKLDPRTLPTGYRLTSENPRVVRLTQGKTTKLNFAAANLRVISLALGDTSFKAGSLSMTPSTLRDIARILPLLEEEPSILKITYKVEDRDNPLASERLEAAESLIKRAWQAKSRPHDLEIEIK
ncbi:MAG: hypothetical protein QNJ29_03650 [Rhizobiaceae bacterium]|nr:hypothetical protein [Rhizobiaceae bacterium]